MKRYVQNDLPIIHRDVHDWGIQVKRTLNDDFARESKGGREMTSCASEILKLGTYEVISPSWKPPEPNVIVSAASHRN